MPWHPFCKKKNSGRLADRRLNFQFIFNEQYHPADHLNMTRIKVQISGRPLAVIRIPVRITDLNYGNHVGNDSMVGIVHEARVQWLALHHYTELEMEGSSLIMAGLAVEYVNEAFYGDELSVEVLAGSLSAAGFELYYDVKCRRNNTEIVICRARTDMVCYDYTHKKVKTIPEAVKKMLQ